MGTVPTVWLPFVFSSGWTSGVNAYMTVLELGLLGRYFDVDAVPDALMRTDVLIAAAVMYLIEFVTDKVPYFDSIWDSIHTAIRPAIGGMLGLLSTGDAETLAQAFAVTIGGGVALASHLVKASVRAVVNLSPEPATNVSVSILEDVTVGGLVVVILVAPWLAFGIAFTLLTVGIAVVWVLQKKVRAALVARAARRRRTESPA